MIILLYPKNESMNREGKIMKLLIMRIIGYIKKFLKNHGIIVEFIVLLLFNFIYFFVLINPIQIFGFTF